MVTSHPRCPAIVLDGGYKAFRSWCKSTIRFAVKPCCYWWINRICKTEVIRELGQMERVIDLEGMAKHFGSAFGNLEGLKQPTSKQFSNDLYHVLRKMDAWGEEERPIWVENESRTIGKVNLPEPFYTQMINSPCYEMVRTEEDRVEHLVNMYGEIDTRLLAGAFKKSQPN